MEYELILDEEYGPEGLVDVLEDIAQNMKSLEEGGTYRVEVTWAPDRE
jgi:hypothetical protein